MLTSKEKLREKKNNLLEQIEHFESLHESGSLTPFDFSQWKDCQLALYRIYHDEETHWQ